MNTSMMEQRTRIDAMKGWTALLRMVQALTLLAALNACGGQSAPQSTSEAVSLESTAGISSDNNYLKVTLDEYGLLTPNYYYSSNNATFWSIQANVANGLHDENYRCVIRIDISKPNNGAMPKLGKTFTLGGNSPYDKFPGDFFVFNGHESVYKKVELGTISLSSDSNASGSVAGVFDIIITDYDSTLTLKPQYRIVGAFGFTVDTYGPANPLPAEVYPEQGKYAYDNQCSSCHGLGKYDPMMESASDLAMRGGELPTVYDSTAAIHQSVSLDNNSMQALRIFVNAW
jgi:hypothetical protein